MRKQADEAQEWQSQQKAVQEEQTHPIVKFLHFIRNYSQQADDYNGVATLQMFSDMYDTVEEFPEHSQEAWDLMQQKLAGQPIDEAKVQAGREYALKAGATLSSFGGPMGTGGGKGGKAKASVASNQNRQTRFSQGSKGPQAYRAANRNGLSSQSQRSEAANRLYSDMRAVANGGKGGSRPAFLDLEARTDGTKFGIPERMSGEQWIKRSTNVPSMSASSSGSSNASRSGSSSASSGSSTSTSAGTSFGSGKITSDKRVNGHTSKLGRTLDGKEERKGKEREGGRRSSANSNPATIPNISENHDRVAHDGYYTRKNERTDQHNWQQRIKNAKPADYIKHTKARTAEEAKRMSETGERNAQYLPQIDNKQLEKLALSQGIKAADKGSVAYFFYKSENIIGYDDGNPTQWIRAEITSSNTYHGHPMSQERVRKYIKNAT